MTHFAKTTICSDCGAVVDESIDQPTGLGPCSRCGSTARIISAQGSDSITFRDGAAFKLKSPGFKEPRAEGFTKPSVSGSTGREVEHIRRIDRRNDTYFELVTDYESGEEIHRCEEKLSEHTGHGSDKKAPRK